MKFFFLLLLFFFGLYLYTLCPTVASQGDSGELVAASYFLSVAHPPGYPLYTLLGHVFTLIPYGSVAWRVNLLSAVLHSLAVAVFYLIVKRLTKNSLLAALTAGALGLSYTFWLYSEIAEVFSLNDLLALIIILLTIRIDHGISWAEAKSKLMVIAFVFGLGMANNHTIVLILPAVFFWVAATVGEKFWQLTITTRIKSLVVIGLAGLAGLVPYLYLPWRARTIVVPVAWSYPERWSDLWQLFIRADYGTFAPAVGSDPALVTLLQKGRQLLTYLKFVLDDFQLWGMLLAAIGVIWGLIKRRKETVFLLLGFFVSGVFFLSYANFPYADSSGTGLEIIERFYLLPNLFVALLLAMGTFALIELASKYYVVRFLTMPLFLVYLVSLFLTHFPAVNQNNNYLGQLLGRDILRGVPSGSLVYPAGDVPIFTTLYVRYVEGFRPDTEVISGNMTTLTNGFRYLRMVRPDLDWSLPRAASEEGIVMANYGKVPIYVSLFTNFSADSQFVASPAGFLLQVKRKNEAVDFDVWYQNNENIIKQYAFGPDHNLGRIATAGDFAVQSNYNLMYLKLGAYCLSASKFDCALKYFSTAHQLDPLRLESFVGLAQTYEKLQNCEMAERSYLSIVDLNPNVAQIYSDLSRVARECFKDSDKEKYYQKLLESKNQLPLNNLKKL